jgi:hypothetical protein
MSNIMTCSAVSFLSDLRTEVLNHSDKRMPKWKFRIAPDVVMELQPSASLVSRGTKVRIFNGFALMAEGASKVMLKSADARYESGLPYWMTKFSINTGMEPQLPWELCLFGARCKHNAGRDGVETLQRRIIKLSAANFSTG